jgi:anti-sigma regulatory factor (Ser/Thr protein kinase)
MVSAKESRRLTPRRLSPELYGNKSTNDMVELRAQYRGTPRSVREARKAIVDYARLCGFSEQLTVEIALAAGEGLANAVEHGNKDLGFISLVCRFEAGVLTVEITDEGAGFDFVTVGKRNREPSSVRGFGITIMRSLMDAVEYADRGRMVRMRKRLVADEQAPAQDSREA